MSKSAESIETKVIIEKYKGKDTFSIWKTVEGEKLADRPIFSGQRDKALFIFKHLDELAEFLGKDKDKDPVKRLNKAKIIVKPLTNSSEKSEKSEKRDKSQQFISDLIDKHYPVLPKFVDREKFISYLEDAISEALQDTRIKLIRQLLSPIHVVPPLSAFFEATDELFEELKELGGIPVPQTHEANSNDKSSELDKLGNTNNETLKKIPTIKKREQFVPQPCEIRPVQFVTDIEPCQKSPIIPTLHAVLSVVLFFIFTLLFARLNPKFTDNLVLLFNSVTTFIRANMDVVTDGVQNYLNQLSQQSYVNYANNTIKINYFNHTPGS